MDTQQSNPRNGHTPIGQRVDEIGATAQHLVEEARGAVRELSEALDLRGRVERHPYAMVAIAAGVGYLLGGGLFTPTTSRMVRLGTRLAALPLVKDELWGLAEAALGGSPGQSIPVSETEH